MTNYVRYGETEFEQYDNFAKTLSNAFEQKNHYGIEQVNNEDIEKILRGVKDDYRWMKYYTIW